MIEWQKDPIISIKHKTFFRKSVPLKKLPSPQELREQQAWIVHDKGHAYAMQRCSPEKFYASEIKPMQLQRPDGLKPWQVEPVSIMVAGLQQHQFVLDGSSTGAGKTYMAAAVCRELGISPIVFCPKTIVPVWRHILRNMGVQPMEVINYEQARLMKFDYLTKTTKTVIRRGKEVQEVTPIWRVDKKESFIIFDEVHRARNFKALTTKLLSSAVAQGLRGLMLSATAADSPLHLYAIAYALGLYSTLSKHYTWAQIFGAEVGEYGNALVYHGGKPGMARLHHIIFGSGRGVRVDVTKVPNFPKNQNVAETFDLETKTLKKVNKIYETLDDELEDEPGEHLAALTRARVATEIAKVSLFVDLAEDLLEEGSSVVIFVNFDESREQIADALEKWGVSQIHGKQSQKQRHEAIDDFQADRNRVCVANTRAGGISIGLHDINGNFPRVALHSPNWSAVDTKQSFGRIWRDGQLSPSLQKIVYAAGTVEEDVCEKVRRKIDQMDALNEGDLAEPFLARVRDRSKKSRKKKVS